MLKRLERLVRREKKKETTFKHPALLCTVTDVEQNVCTSYPKLTYTNEKQQQKKILSWSIASIWAASSIYSMPHVHSGVCYKELVKQHQQVVFSSIPIVWHNMYTKTTCISFGRRKCLHIYPLSVAGLADSNWDFNVT